MTRRVVAILISAKISDVIKLMSFRKIGGLPVVNLENRVQGVITVRDVVNVFADKISGVKVS